MNIMKISSVFVLFVMSFNLYGEQLNVSYCGPKYGPLYVNLKSDDALYTNLYQCRFVYKYIYSIGDCYFNYHFYSSSDFINEIGIRKNESYNDIILSDITSLHFMHPIVADGIFLIGKFCGAPFFNLEDLSIGFLKNRNEIFVSQNESNNRDVYCFKDISKDTFSDACGAQIEDFCGDIIYKNYQEALGGGFIYNATYALAKIDKAIDPKLIMRFYDFDAYRGEYFNKTGILLEKPDVLDLLRRKDDAFFDNEKFNESISNCLIARNILNNLSGKWQVQKPDNMNGKFIKNIVSQLGYVCGMFTENGDTNRSSISIKFISYDFKGNIILSVFDLKFKKNNGFIRCEVKKNNYVANISNFSNANIVWFEKNPSGKHEIIKWEISGDFSEVKEYHKNKDNWIWSSTMKKFYVEN